MIRNELIERGNKLSENHTEDELKDSLRNVLAIQEKKIASLVMSVKSRKIR